MQKKITLEINQRVGSFKKGDTVRINVDENGTPLDKYWRRRLKDAERDHCVTVQKTRSASKQAKIETPANDKPE